MVAKAHGMSVVLFWTLSSFVSEAVKLVIDRTPARSFNPSYSQSDQSTDLNQWIKTLSSGSDSIPVLKKLITFSVQNSVIEPSSPAGGQFPGSPTPNANKKVVEELPRANVWTHDKVFDRLFDALMAYLDPTRVSAFDLQYMCWISYCAYIRHRTS